MKKKPEYVEGRQALENFENAMEAIIKVPHSEIKAKLDAEKKARDARPPRKASRRVKPEE